MSFELNSFVYCLKFLVLDALAQIRFCFMATFFQVKNLTSNIQLILDSLRTSTVVEVQVIQLVFDVFIILSTNHFTLAMYGYL